MEAMITPSKKKVLQEISSNTPRRGKMGLQGKVKDMAILPSALQFKKAQVGCAKPLKRPHTRTHTFQEWAFGLS